MNREKFIAIIIMLLCIISIIIGIFLLAKGKVLTKPWDSPGVTSIIAENGDAIGVVDLYGEIDFQPSSLSFGASSGADSIVEKINSFAKNSRVKAIIIRINSPGGTVGATQEIYDSIIRARKKGIKVVASLGDIAASGGYYVASASDKIVANRGTITGSIGVLITSPNLKELFEKYGIKYNVIKSGKHKDILAFWRDLSAEEQELLQITINNVYEQFVKAVSEGRKIKVEKIKEIADGRIFSGEQAFEIGLIDDLGGFEEAKDLAARLAHIKGEPVILKDIPSPFEKIFKLLNTETGSKIRNVDILDKTPLKYLYPGSLKLVESFINNNIGN